MNEQVKVLARYQPVLNDKRWTTKVCDGGNNGGIHNQRQFKKLVAMLEYAAHNWRNARLYHLVLKGASRAIYQQVLTKFCRQLRSTGAQCDYMAAIEQDSDKGLHQHVMFVMATEGRPSRYITAANESGIVDASLLRQIVREVQAECSALACHVQPPTQRTVAYIELNQTNNEFLNEAVTWASYIVKARSKLPASEGRCYTSSRRSRRCVKVGKAATPPVCLAVCAVSKPESKNIHFPSSPEGKKCRKRPVYKGFPYLKATLPSVQPLKTGVNQYETGGFSRFIAHSSMCREMVRLGYSQTAPARPV